MDMINPIRSVTPIDAYGVATGPAVVDLPRITGYKYVLKDVGGSADRRTENRKIVNKRIGQAVRLELEWKPVTVANAAVIIQAFHSKYLLITYLDAKAGGWVTKDFAVDNDRNTVLLNSEAGLWDSIGFALEQRTPDLG